MKKGSFGYIKKKRTCSLLKSAFLLAAVFAVFLVARHHYGTNKNYFSILAALGALPAGRSVVVSVLCLRARPASAGARDAISAILDRNARPSPLPQGYDIYLTAYDRAYSLSHVAAGEEIVIGLMEDPAGEPGLCEAYLADVLKKDGHAGCEVHIYTDFQEYLASLEILAATAGQGAGDAGAQEIMDLVYAISL